MNSLKNKFLLALLFCIASVNDTSAQTFTSKAIKVNLFSSTPIEDIKAVSYTGVAVLVGQRQEITVQVAIKSLAFDKKLMQEHFNENYMESDKYPLAKFKGVIESKIDWKKEGEYPVVVKGSLWIHGVEKPRTITGKIRIKDNIISINSALTVPCADHQIKIPSLMFTKIAEVIAVNIQGNLTLLN